MKEQYYLFNDGCNIKDVVSQIETICWMISSITSQLGDEDDVPTFTITPYYPTEEEIQKLNGKLK